MLSFPEWQPRGVDRTVEAIDHHQLNFSIHWYELVGNRKGVVEPWGWLSLGIKPSSRSPSTPQLDLLLHTRSEEGKECSPVTETDILYSLLFLLNLHTESSVVGLSSLEEGLLLTLE